MKIFEIEYAKSTLPETMIFINGEEGKKHEIVFKVYLIKTDEKLILVDAGCETMPGFIMRDFVGSVNELKNRGVDPLQITDVIITHSHHDHIECVKYFKNAQIFIEENEYEDAKQYISEELNVNVFCNKLFVDKNIKVLKIGGHSKGSCIVEITDDEKIYVIVGDECYKRECMDKKIPTGSYYNKEASENFIKKYSDKKYTLLFSHDN